MLTSRELDAADPLASFRELFHIPRARDVAGPQWSGSDEPSVYLVGNSLGLMPRATRAAMEQELDDWARLGVEGHFHAAHPWFPYHETMREPLSRLLGALPREVVAMNTLTGNLHLLMVSFYRPTRVRYKIVIEDTAFPSDSYAVASQAEFHARTVGFDPTQAIIRLKARPGEETLRTADILERIDREKNSIALVMLGGVNYLTGQCFDMKEITAFARSRGIVVGWDLAHAAGNIDTRLHDWGADFAAWCSYKYLNSGPGAIAGAFVHERHLDPGNWHAVGKMPRFAGWWGNDPKTRFKMEPMFEPVASADAWSLSNPSVFASAPLRVSLELFDRAGIGALREKSAKLTAFMQQLLDGLNERAARAGADSGRVEVLTPRDFAARGCQFSLRLRTARGGGRTARDLHKGLLSAGIVTDFREPDVIRAAPAPLYNSFADVERFVTVLSGLLLNG